MQGRGCAVKYPDTEIGRRARRVEFQIKTLREEGAALVKTLKGVDRTIGELSDELAMLQAAIIDSGAAK